MLKKVYIIGLSILIVLSLAIPSFAWSELPEDSSYLNMTWSNRWIYWDRNNSVWYSRNRSPSLLLDNDWNSSLQGSVFSYVTPAIIFSDAPLNDPYILQSATTYYMEYVILGTEPMFSYNANPDNYWFVTKDNLSNVFGDWSNSQVTVSDPFNNNYKVPITNVTTDRSYSETANGSKSYRIRFAFTTNAGVSDLNLAAIMMPSSGYYENQAANMYISAFTAWYDPTGDIYDTVVAEGINKVNTNLEHIQTQIDGLGSQLGDIQDSIEGDPNDYQDNSGFDSAAGDYEDLENQINDQISGNITLPDGSSIPTNGGVFTGITSWFKNNFSPQDYESSAGNQISRVFEFFLPFVGIPILINLTLAVILSFLRGRSNA